MKKLALTLAMLASLNATTAFAGVVEDENMVPLEEEKPQESLIDRVKMVQDAFKDADQKRLEKTVREFTYDRKKTYKIPLRVGTTTTFVFDEPIQTHIQGASLDVFQTAPFINTEADYKRGEKVVLDNLHYVKALSPNKDTTITFIAESGRLYNFYLYSLGRDSEELPVVTVYVHLDDNSKQVVDKKKAEADKKAAKKLEVDGRRINLDENNAFSAYMRELFASDVNNNYQMYGADNSDQIAPLAVFDNGRRTFFNFDGVLPSNEVPAVFKVVDGVEIPEMKKDAFILDKAFKGWVMVDTVSQEGFTLRVGDKFVCVKPTVNLQNFHKKIEEAPKRKVVWEEQR